MHIGKSCFNFNILSIITTDVKIILNLFFCCENPMLNKGIEKSFGQGESSKFNDNTIDNHNYNFRL